MSPWYSPQDPIDNREALIVPLNLILNIPKEIMKVSVNGHLLGCLDTKSSVINSLPQALTVCLFQLSFNPF